MKIYKFAKPQRHLLIIFSLSLLTIFLLLTIYFTIPFDGIGFIWLAIILMAIIIVFTFGTVTNKIILSPLGFEYVSFGISLLMSWSLVEKIGIDDFGFISIFFKEPIFRNRWANRILLPIATGHVIQLSSFIDDVSSTNLIKDIKHFAPDCDISDVELLNGVSRKE